MKKILTLVFVLVLTNIAVAQTEESNDYVEFDDRNNVVHGFYLGLSANYGKINSQNAYLSTLKLAYVANQKLEIGLAFTGLYSEVPNRDTALFTGDKVALIGGYAGIHVEPILFGKKFISVSFPVLVGAGVVAYSDIDEIQNDTADLKEDDFDEYFVVEPGVNLLYNFTRFTQLETGIRYRFTSKYEIAPFAKDNLNGFSVVVGLKVGIFNLGRKKPIKDNF